MREEHSNKEIKKEKADVIKRQYTPVIPKSNNSKVDSKTRANISSVKSATTSITTNIWKIPYVSSFLILKASLTYDSPSLYEPPTITGDLEPEPSNIITEQEPEEFEPPNMY